MILKNLRNIAIILFGFCISYNAKAQIYISDYSDFGETNVSEGFYIKNSIYAAYKNKKLKFSTAHQFDIKSPSDNILTASLFQLERDFLIKKFSFSLKTLYLYNRFSELIHETNWGFLAINKQKHFTFNIGTNFRKYKITNTAMERYNLSSNLDIKEYWNLMYLIDYSLKPNDNNWNIGISLTNIDYFIINQETNPIFYLHGKYRLKKPITFFMETWYKTSGNFNISVNYFGFFVRTGIIWEIKTGK